MSHTAILQAVKQRTHEKRRGRVPVFEYQPRTKLIEPAIGGKFDATKIEHVPKKYKRGCHPGCFCCSPVERDTLGTDEMQPLGETEIEMEIMLQNRPCHSRLNHRAQYSGVYKRWLSQPSQEEKDVDFDQMRHTLSTAARVRCADLESTMKWGAQLRGGNPRNMQKSLNHFASTDAFPRGDKTLTMRPATSNFTLSNSRSISHSRAF